MTNKSQSTCRFALAVFESPWFCCDCRDDWCDEIFTWMIIEKKDKIKKNRMSEREGEYTGESGQNHRSSLSRCERLDSTTREQALVHACSIFCSQRGSASYNGLARSLDRRLEPAARGRSEADRFNSGNSCWSCSRIHLTRPVLRGRVRMENSSLPIRTKSRVDGASARANPTWITTSCRAR